MGTNYYFKIKDIRKKEIEKHLTNIEKDLLDLDFRLHIGKSSVGWTFTFQATRYYRSYKELLDFYEENKNSLMIVNEYEEPVDIEKFKDIVEYKRNEENNHTKYVENDEEYGQYSYLDDEGNSFNEIDFS